MSGTTPTYTYSLMQVPPAMQMILRSDGLVIPADPSNANFPAWQAWVNAGNRPPMVLPPTKLLDATAILSTGLTVTSTSTATLNSTYRADGLAWQALMAEMNALWISNNESFADGTTSVNWPDKSGAAHTFTIAQFKTLVTALSLFVVQCEQYAAGILTTTPSNTATIP